MPRSILPNLLSVIIVFCMFLLPGCGSITAPPETLTLEEYAVRLLDSEGRDFEPLQGSQEEVLRKRQAERLKIADPYDPSGSSGEEISILLQDKPLTASLILTSQGEFTNVTAQVTHSGAVIYALPLGQAGPIRHLQGLWSDGKHWFLEVARYVPDGEYPHATGEIIQDGESLNFQYRCKDAFSFQLLRGKPFFFCKRLYRVYIIYDGQEMAQGYDSVVHYGCCSGARLNPIKAENMISFFATRGDTWYYAEAGVYPR